MPDLTYTTVDKTAWGPGPWTGEPDKVQWTDPATGLACLAVRNDYMGNWCGYVGVPPTHPASGLHYDGGSEEAAAIRMDRFKATARKYAKEGYPKDHMDLLKDPLFSQEEDPVILAPLREVRVHGGLTFSGPCHDTSEGAWKLVTRRAKAARASKEAQDYPRGDTARFARRLAPFLEDYPGWVAHQEATAICHKAEEGEPPVWWFGFDCGHSGDLMPGMVATMKEIRAPDLLAQKKGWTFPPDTYRTLEYVRWEIADLARQLKEMETVNAASVEIPTEGNPG